MKTIFDITWAMNNCLYADEPSTFSQAILKISIENVISDDIDNSKILF